MQSVSGFRRAPGALCLLRRVQAPAPTSSSLTVESVGAVCKVAEQGNEEAGRGEDERQREGRVEGTRPAVGKG